jgi:hypothetical protein
LQLRRKEERPTIHNKITNKMKHLLKKILTPITERRLVLPLLGFAAGLPGLPALAQEAAQVTTPAAVAPTEQLPAGFTEKNAVVHGVRIGYK